MSEYPALQIYHILTRRKQNQLCYLKHREKRLRKFKSRYTKQPICEEKLIYLLKTNKIVSLNEMVAYTGNTKETIRTTLPNLRDKGYKIKYGMGMYYYGGLK